MWNFQDPSDSPQRPPSPPPKWVSSRDNRNTRPSANLQAEHRALFERGEATIFSTCASMQRALVDLQLQLMVKMRQLREQQELLLQTRTPSEETVEEFRTNVTKIDRSFDSCTAHADNLSHIKLTLARLAAFVSPEGNIAQLITAPPAVRVRESPPWNAEQNPSSATFTTLATIGPVRRSCNSSERLLERQLSRRLNSQLEILAGSNEQMRSESPYARFHDERAYTCEDFNSARELSPPRGVTPRIPNSTCFVFYLPPAATNDTLRQLFVRYGTVLNAYVAMDKVTNRTRGFGFVDMATPQEAQAAVAGLDKYPWDSKFLSVSIKV
jgi:hypothetical protein